MAYRIGINGFGRIGRQVLRRLLEKRNTFEVAAINDLSPPETLAHLFRYDTVHGRYPGTVEVKDGSLVIDGKPIKILQIKSPVELPWRDLKVDFAIESTGRFTARSELEQHLKAGARKVFLSAPPKDAIDITVVPGVNNAALRPEHKIISAASCTTNCLSPMALVLHEKFGIKSGLMTTIHAYTNDQVILDGIHKDLRRARSAAANIIPTSTGAAKAVGEVIPALKGKLTGIAMRVPVPDGSVTDLVAVVEKEATPEAINKAMKEAAEGKLKGILVYSEDPLVSSDVIGSSASCTFDALSTMVLDKNLVKIIGWYDNEWGYTCRLVDVIEMAGKLG
jgi:glyceraldehyde 3-phosphate dehydrogenase